MSCVSCDSECRTSAAAFEPIEVSGEFRKISYTRDYLLSLVEVNVPKSLPTGFDRSILSELDDACKSECEHQKLPGNESPFTGRTLVDSSRSSSEKWGGCKLSSEDSKSTGCKVDRFLYKSAPENQKFPLLESPFTGKIYSDSSRDSSEKWGSCKLSSEDSKSTDTCLVLDEHPTVPEITSQKNPSPVSPAICGSVVHPCYGEASEECRTEESPDHHLLTQDPVVQQLPSKSQLIKMDSGLEIDVEELQGQILEGGRFSALINLKEAEEIDAYFLDEKHDVLVDDGRNSYRTKSKFIHWFPENDEANCNVSPGAEKDGWKVWGAPTRKSTKENHSGQRKPEEASTYSQKAPCSKKIEADVLDCLGSDHIEPNNSYPDDISYDSGSIQESYELDKVTDNADLSLELNLPDEDSLIAIDDIYIFKQEEPNPPKITTRGGRVSPSPDPSPDPWFHESRKTRSENVQQNLSFPDPWFHESQKTGSENVQQNLSFPDPWFHESQKTGSENVQQNLSFPDPWFHESQKTGSENVQQNLSFPDPWFHESQKTGSENVQQNLSFPDPWFHESQKTGSENVQQNLSFPDPWFHESQKTGSENVQQNLSFPDPWFHESQKTGSENVQQNLSFPDPWFHESQKTGSENVQQNLSFPDPWFHESQKTGSENVQQNLSFPDPWFHESQKTGSENVQQNLSFPDPWFHESQKSGSENVQQNFNLPDPWFHESHVNAPPTFHYPLNRYNHYNPYAFIPPTFGHQTQNYEPIQNFPQPRMSHADDDYCPELDKILSTDPSNYHQFLQTPCCDSEPNVLRSIPLNYQTNVKSTMDMGKRGFLANERVKSAINHYLHIQRMLAQRNLEAAEQRAYSQALSNRFW
ncbi:hypothetical protein SOVF_076890 [Spinacia oleracea]|nr:hypothetical protein SOVF_076890 [Spinacia oleracea]